MSGNMESAIIALLVIFTIGFIITGISLIIIYNRHKRELEKLMKYEINVGASIDEQIPLILQMFVDNVFADYRAMYLEPMEEIYITSEKETQITKEMTDLCSRRLSSAMVDKLSLFWNYSAIGAVIADKIYLTVVSYCANHNAVITSQSVNQQV